MSPTEHELTVGVDAAARVYWAAAGAPHLDGVDHPRFDDLDALLQLRIRESVLPMVAAVLEAVPDRTEAARREGIVEGRQQIAFIVREHMCTCGLAGDKDGHESWCPASVLTEAIDDPDHVFSPGPAE